MGALLSRNHLVWGAAASSTQANGEFFLAYSLVRHNLCQVSLSQKSHYWQLGGVDWPDIKRVVISDLEIVAHV